MGRPRSANKRISRLVAPASEEEAEDYVKACKKAEIEPADTLRKLAKALEKQVEEYGYVTFPLRLAPPEKKPTKH